MTRLSSLSSRTNIIVAAVLLATTVASADAGAQQPAAGPGETLRLTLKEAVAIAHEQGTQATGALKARDAARANDRRFRSGLLPQVSLTGTVPSYNRAIVPVTQPDGSTLFRSQQQNQSALTVNVAQQLPMIGGSMFVRSGLSRLDLSGERQSRSWSGTPFQIGITQGFFRLNEAAWDARAQDLRVDISERQYLEAREDAAIAVTNAFFDVYAAGVTLSNALTSAAIYDTLYALNKGRYEVGRIGPTDLQQGLLQHLRARAAVDNARLGYERALAALRIQLRLPVGFPVEVIVPEDIPDIVPDTSVAVAQAMRNTSGVLSLDLQELEARRRVSEASLGRGINATLQASVGYNQTAPEMNLVYRDLLQSRQYSLAVTVPVWQGGARGAQIEAAKLDEGRIAGTVRQSREQTAMEAHYAALELIQARRQYGMAAQVDTGSASLFELTRQRYLIGRIALQEVLNAQNSRDQAVTSYLAARRGYWVAYYRLRRITLYDFEKGARITADRASSSS